MTFELGQTEKLSCSICAGLELGSTVLLFLCTGLPVACQGIVFHVPRVFKLQRKAAPRSLHKYKSTGGMTILRHESAAVYF